MNKTKDHIINEPELLKGAEVIKYFRLGTTAGYRYLAHLEKNNKLLPVRLPGLKQARWRREEVEALCKNREFIDCPDFQVHQNLN